MSKSLYSLILNDEVVARIDREAQRSGGNRSGLINEILADYVSYVTPEQHIERVFGALSNYICKGVEILNSSKAHTIAMKSALQLKYRPSVTYEVELYRTGSGGIGELKINCRSGSEEVLTNLYRFMQKWIEMEERFVLAIFPDRNVEYYLEGCKFRRIFHLAGEGKISDEKLSKNIGEYIMLLDKAMKKFLYEESGDFTDVEKEYLEYLNKGIIII